MRASARLALIGFCALWVPPGLVARSQQLPSAETALQQADAMFAEGRYGEAREVYRLALAAEDRQVSSRAATGLVLSLLRVAEFATAYKEAHDLRQAQPDDPVIAALYGDALWASGVFEQAETTFLAALSRDPAHARARHGLARSLAAQNRLTAALVEAQEAVRLDPLTSDFRYTLAYIHERMGRFDTAAEAYTRYVELIPNRDPNGEAAWTRVHIGFLRSFKGRQPLDMGPGADARVWTVPISIEDDKVFVEARINGGAHTLVLDTGTEQTTISVDVARRQRVVPISSVRAAGVGEIGVRSLQVGRIDSLQIGDLTVRNVPCLIKNPPLGGLPRRESETFSPLALGLSMRVDYRRRQLVLARNLIPAARTAHRLPLRLHRLAMVGGTLNGTLRAAFVIDTAGQVISISHTTAGLIDPGANVRHIPLRVYGTSGWDKDAFLLPDVDLELNTVRFDGIPVVVLDLRAPSALLGFQLGGILGHKFLSPYTVSIDLARSVVELEP